MPNDIDALFSARAGTAATDGQMTRISDLIREEVEIEGAIATAEELLKQGKERQRELKNSLIPTAMLDAGVREFTTSEGFKSKIVFVTDGALGSPKTEEERREREAKLDTIIEFGGGEIVKQTVTLTFPKEMIAEAEGFRDWMAKEVAKRAADKPIWGLVTVNRERSVHHQTLGSWVRERMASDTAEEQLPPAFFERTGLWHGEAAKISVPKPKGGQ